MHRHCSCFWDSRRRPWPIRNHKKNPRIRRNSGSLHNKSQKKSPLSPRNKNINSLNQSTRPSLNPPRHRNKNSAPRPSRNSIHSSRQRLSRNSHRRTRQLSLKSNNHSTPSSKPKLSKSNHRSRKLTLEKLSMRNSKRMGINRSRLQIHKLLIAPNKLWTNSMRSLNYVSAPEAAGEFQTTASIPTLAVDTSSTWAIQL